MTTSRERLDAAIEWAKEHQAHDLLDILGAPMKRKLYVDIEWNQNDVGWVVICSRHGDVGWRSTRSMAGKVRAQHIRESHYHETVSK